MEQAVHSEQSFIATTKDDQGMLEDPDSRNNMHLDNVRAGDTEIISPPQQVQGAEQLGAQPELHVNVIDPRYARYILEALYIEVYL